MKLFAWLFLFPSAVISAAFNSDLIADFDEILHVLLGPQFSYSAVSFEMKREIQYVHYFMMQINYPNGSPIFTSDLFFKMISTQDGFVNLVHNPQDSDVISHDTRMNLKNSLIYEEKPYKYINSYSIPRFPELSTEIFKLNQNNRDVQIILIKNAINSPLISVKFLNFLGKQVFQSNLFVLGDKLKRIYNLSSCPLGYYKIITIQLRLYHAIEYGFLAAMFSCLAVYYQSFNLSLLVLIPFVILISLTSASFYLTYFFTDFPEISSFEYLRFSLLRNIIIRSSSILNKSHND